MYFLRIPFFMKGGISMENITWLNWLINTGLNDILIDFVKNNATVIFPLVGIFWAWFKRRAKNTKAKWDDDLVAAIQESDILDVIEKNKK
jgi:hypothetical protein